MAWLGWPLIIIGIQDPSDGRMGKLGEVASREVATELKLSSNFSAEA